MKEQAEKQKEVLEDNSTPEIKMVGTMNDIPEDTSITHELTELTGLYNQIRLMNKKLKTPK